MKYIFFILIFSTLLFCSPKGPETYKSSFVGKSKADLIQAKGTANVIKIFDNSEAHIYKIKEAYFGKNAHITTEKDLIPKKHL